MDYGKTKIGFSRKTLTREKDCRRYLIATAATVQIHAKEMSV
jgi:hypothetical protein